jgi:hypothetical protein
MIRFTRRSFIIGATAIGVAALVRPALAGEAEAANAVAWLLGDNLSLGALLYARGAEQKNIDSYIDQARAIAKNINLTVPDLPARGSDDATTMSTVVHYLIDGDGWHVGEQLAADFGDTAGLLFEVAVKSNLLILLYEPGDDSGIGAIVKSRLTGVLPPEYWQPLLDAIDAKKPAADVQAAVLDMHKTIANYLVKAAGQGDAGAVSSQLEN